MAQTVYYSHSALSQAAAGRAPPSLAVTLAFAQACGGDREEWIALWREAAAAAGVPAEAVTLTEPVVPAGPDGHAASAGPSMEDGPGVVARHGIRARLALVGRRGWHRLAAAGLVGGLL
jgi:hypothetical protein